MFTGLVEGLGKIREIRRVGSDLVLTVTPSFGVSDSRIGDSIAVNGVCLTVTFLGDDTFTMDVSGETVSCSTMGLLRQGEVVNLERALKFTDRLGGHLVSGHVDGTGRILKKEQRQKSWLLRVGVDEALARYTIEKGSICVDGVSLTINYCHDTYFEVNIIPQTGRETTLLNRKVGDLVNIETDLIGKYVEKFFRESGDAAKKERSDIDPEILREYGFKD
jgi:riboflavin synthase